MVISMNQNNLDKLISAALAIEAREAKEAGALGYMGRALIQATMPHSKVEGNEFVRKNGSFTLTMLAPSEIGLPYGSIPRLLTAWMSTEAVRTRQRELVLGRSLSEFMNQLGLTPTGGRWGSITRLKDQMRRLFSSTISYRQENTGGEAGMNIQVAEGWQLWWEPQNPDQAALWESTLLLTPRFFNEIINHPIPLDIRVLKALSRSPMALDIYCWLTYRMSYLKRNIEIPWGALQLQFGANYANDAQGIRNFKRYFLEGLKKIQPLWPSLSAGSSENGLLLKPSQPHIPKL